MPPPAGGIIFAFDYGRARTGIAIGETITGSVRPLSTLPCRDGAPDWAQLDRLIQEWQPAQLIVGLPLALNGTETPSARAAQRFARQLTERYGLTTALHDERLSSREAEQRVAQARRNGQLRRRRKQIDATAASIILESWLQENA